MTIGHNAADALVHVVGSVIVCSYYRRLSEHTEDSRRGRFNEHIQVYYTLLLHSASSPAESYYNLVTR